MDWTLPHTQFLTQHHFVAHNFPYWPQTGRTGLGDHHSLIRGSFEARPARIITPSISSRWYLGTSSPGEYYKGFLGSLPGPPTCCSPGRNCKGTSTISMFLEPAPSPSQSRWGSWHREKPRSKLFTQERPTQQLLAHLQRDQPLLMMSPELCGEGILKRRARKQAGYLWWLTDANGLELAKHFQIAFAVDNLTFGNPQDLEGDGGNFHSERLNCIKLLLIGAVWKGGESWQTHMVQGHLRL